MALTYLSGDIGKLKRKSKSEKKEKKEQKKEKRKTRRKKIAKVGLLPARAAFLTATELNLGKLATKLLRAYKKDQNKLKAFWVDKFKGDWDKLKKAISKGSKQQISGDDIGQGAAAVAATALPILIALVPLLKTLGVQGEQSEAAEYDQLIDTGKKEMAESDEYSKGTADMPEDKEVGVVKGGKTPGTNDKDGKEPVMGSMASPLGMSFNGLLFCMILSTSFPSFSILFSIFSLYFFIGFVLCPLYYFGNTYISAKVYEYYNFPIATVKSLFNGKKSSYKESR